jgi:hypothetical protein
MRKGACPSGSEQKIPAVARLFTTPEQYPINPKNPLNPEETFVSVARNLWC